MVIQLSIHFQGIEEIKGDIKIRRILVQICRINSIDNYAPTLVNFIIRVYSYSTTTCSFVERFSTTCCSEMAFFVIMKFIHVISY